MEDLLKLENALPEIERKTKKIDALVGKKFKVPGCIKRDAFSISPVLKYGDPECSIRSLDLNGNHYCNFDITTTGIVCVFPIFNKNVEFKISLKKLLQYIAAYEQSTQEATA